MLSDSIQENPPGGSLMTIILQGETVLPSEDLKCYEQIIGHDVSASQFQDAVTEHQSPILPVLVQPELMDTSPSAKNQGIGIWPTGFSQPDLQSAIPSGQPSMLSTRDEMDQPALAIVQFEESVTRPFSQVAIQSESHSASQLVPSTFSNAGNTASVPSDKAARNFPLLGQFPSSKTSADINNLKILSVCLQNENKNENCNNSASKTDTDTPFSPTSLFLNSDHHPKLPMTISTSKKLFCLSQDKEQVLPAFSMHDLSETDIIEQTVCVKESEVATKPQNVEKDNNRLSYSRALAPPPNALSSSLTGSHPECGIIVELLHGFSLDSYGWAIVKVVGEKSITFIGRHPTIEDTVLIFVKTSVLAEQLVHEGIWLKNRWLNVSHFQQPAVKLTVGGVMPFVPDTLIIEAFTPYGESVYPVLRRIPAAVRHQKFKGALSFRREIYLVKSSRDSTLPKSININFLGISYPLEISTTGPKCFSCGSLTHTVNKCDKDNNNNAEDNVQDTLPSVKDNISSTMSGHYKTGPQQPCSRDFFTQCNMADLPSILPLVPLVKECNNNKNDNSICNNNVKKKKANINNNKKKVNMPVKSPVFGPPFIKFTSTDSQPPMLESNSKLPILTTSQVTYNKDLYSSTKESFEMIKKPKKTINQPISDAVRSFQTTSNMFDEQLMELEQVDPTSEDPQDCLLMPSKPLSNFEQLNDKHKNCILLQPHKDAFCKNKEKNSFIDTTSPPAVSIDPVFALTLAEDWLKKSANLKKSPKKKITIQLLNLHPNLEEIISTAILNSVSFPPTSAKGR